MYILKLYSYIHIYIIYTYIYIIYIHIIYIHIDGATPCGTETIIQNLWEFFLSCSWYSAIFHEKLPGIWGDPNGLYPKFETVMINYLFGILRGSYIRHDSDRNCYYIRHDWIIMPLFRFCFNYYSFDLCSGATVQLLIHRKLPLTGSCKWVHACHRVEFLRSQFWKK